MLSQLVAALPAGYVGLVAVGVGERLPDGRVLVADYAVAKAARPKASAPGRNRSGRPHSSSYVRTGGRHGVSSLAASHPDCHGSPESFRPDQQAHMSHEKYSRKRRDRKSFSLLFPETDILITK
jgi:hypothetical protein